MNVVSSVPSGDRGEEDAATVIQALRDRPKFARLCIYSLNCLGKLASTRNNLDHIISNDGVSAILDTAERHNKNPRVIKESTNALIKACKVPEYADKIGAEGGVDFCLRQLKRSSDSGSNKDVVKLMLALCNGNPNNIKRFQEAGALDILTKAHKDATNSNDQELNALILQVMEKMTDIPEVCRSMSKEMIKSVVDSLKRYPNNADIVKPALQIICQLVKHCGPEMIQFLRSLGIVDFISAAMDAHPTNQAIASIGSSALHQLSDESDLKKALKEFEKSKDIMERRQAIAMIGNLALIGGNSKLLMDAKTLEKLLKLIRQIIKQLSSVSDEEKLLLSTAMRSATRIGISDPQQTKIFIEKGGVTAISSCSVHDACTAELLVAALVSTDDFCSTDMGYNAVCGDSTLIPSLVSGIERFSDLTDVQVAAMHLFETLAKGDLGIQKIKENNAVQIVCGFVDSNLKNHKIVDCGLNAMLKFADHANKLSETDQKSIINTSLSVLKENANNHPDLCKKALEVLKKMASESAFVRQQLSLYESQSVLSRFKNETNDDALKKMVDELKEILKGKHVPVTNITDALKTLEKESQNLKNGQNEQQTLEKMFEPSEIIHSLICAKGENKEKLLNANGIARLKEITENVEKCQVSDLRDEILNHLIQTLKELMDDYETAFLCVNQNYVDVAMSAYSSYGKETSNRSEEVKVSVGNMLGSLENCKIELLNVMKGNIASNGNVRDLIRFYEQLSNMSNVQNRMPRDLDYGLTQFMKDAADMSIETIKKHQDDNPELVNSAIAMLDVLNKNHEFHDYFVKKYVGELCSIIQNNPDNEFLCSALFGLLAKCGDDADSLARINELKNWYMNRFLETDIEARKMYFLDSVYENMEVKDRENEFLQAMQSLMYCYDPNNDLVSIDGAATRTDEEVAALVMHILDSDQSGVIKQASVDLLTQMIINKNVEQMFYDKGHLESLCQLVRESNLVDLQNSYLLLALTPFLKSDNQSAKFMAQDSINQLLLSMTGGNEADRNALLDTLLTQLNDKDGKFGISSHCLESIISLLKIQQTPEGKAKCVNLLSSMAKSSEETAARIVNGEALPRVLEYLYEYNNEPIYVAAATEFTRVLAEYDDSIPKLEEEKVDERMKDLMFQYNNDMEIFHNAQRTIDLMNLVRLNLTPEQLEKWKERSRSKQLMTEFCRGLGVMISFVLTKAEREVRTGDTSKDIAQEVKRILNEFGTSLDDAIESNAPTGMLTSLATAWLLRAYLMTYSFLVEKDISARAFNNAPRVIEETLVSICDFSAMWDFENPDFADLNLCVRGGIGHQSVRAMFDSSLDPQQCREIDPVTYKPVGREYTLTDLIRWAKMDTGERDTLKCFNLILGWIRINWRNVVITVSMNAIHSKDGRYKKDAVMEDGEFLSLRLGLEWNWPKVVDEKTFYFMKPNENYGTVGAIKRKPKQKGGLLIKVGISGEELRKKRREIKDKLDLSSNVLNGDQKEELDFFLEVSGKGLVCRRFYKYLMTVKSDSMEIKFQQEEDGDLYFSWGPQGAPPEKRNRLNMKEVEAICKGKTTKVLRKSKENPKDDCCMTVIAAGDREINVQLQSQRDRDVWVKGLELVLCTVAGKRPAEMIWQ